MEDLLARLRDVLSSTPLMGLEDELKVLLTSAYRRGAMDFKMSTDNVMVVLDRALEQYEAYAAKWGPDDRTTEAAREAKARR